MPANPAAERLQKSRLEIPLEMLLAMSFVPFLFPILYYFPKVTVKGALLVFS
jgi:hypothetical protein